MSRITTTVLIMLLLMNGSATMMEASGLNEDLGVTLAPGLSDALNDTVQSLRNAVQVSSGLGETLFAMFITAFNVMNIAVNMAIAAPQAFTNVGFPDWVVYPIFGPLYVISTLEIIFAATGRDLV